MTCTYDPIPLLGAAIGMFHCPVCGEMVLAGMAHPDYSNIDADYAAYMAEQDKKNEPLRRAD